LTFTIDIFLKSFEEENFTMNKQLYSTHPVTRQLTLCSLALALTASFVIYPKASKADNSLEVPSELQGEWRYGRISSIQYQDSYTGAPAPTNGSSDQFKLTPNGEYQRTRLLQITTYSCASNVFISEKGKVTVEGQQLTFQPAESTSKGQICNSGRTYEQQNTAKPETYAWSIETNDSGQEVLVLETPDGEGQAHYGRSQ
jgi:hypothetical protein